MPVELKGHGAATAMVMYHEFIHVEQVFSFANYSGCKVR